MNHWAYWGYSSEHKHLRGTCITKQPVSERMLDATAASLIMLPQSQTVPPESHGGCCSWQRDLWDLVIFWPSWVLGTFFLPRGSISDRRRCHHSAHFSQRKTIFLCENIHYHPKAWSPSQKLGMSGENHRFPHKLWASWSLVEWSTDSWVRVKSDKSIQIIYLK